MFIQHDVSTDPAFQQGMVLSTSGTLGSYRENQTAGKIGRGGERGDADMTELVGMASTSTRGAGGICAGLCISSVFGNYCSVGQQGSSLSTAPRLEDYGNAFEILYGKYER